LERLDVAPPVRTQIEPAVQLAAIETKDAADGKLSRMHLSRVIKWSVGSGRDGHRQFLERSSAD